MTLEEMEGEHARKTKEAEELRDYISSLALKIVEAKAIYKRGEVIESKNGDKAVIVSVYPKYGILKPTYRIRKVKKNGELYANEQDGIGLESFWRSTGEFRDSSEA